MIFMAILVLVLSGMSCQKKDTKKSSAALYYFTLLRKPAWTPADRHVFINLFTTRGMNRLLQMNDMGSFQEFQHDRSSIPEATCDFNEFDPSFNFTRESRALELSGLAGADIKIVRPVWFKAEGEKLSPYATQIVLWNGLIHDLYSIPMTRKERIHPLLGIIMLILLVIQTRAARSNVSTLNMSRFATIVVMLIALVINGAIMYGLYMLGGKTFKKITYEPSGSSEFVTDLEALGEPYFGEPSFSVIKNAKESVKKETLELINSAGSRENSSLARTFLSRAKSLSSRGDVKSLNRSIAFLKRSLEYQFNSAAFIELANCYMLLGEANVNTLLNLVRAEAVLNTIQSMEGFRGVKNEISMLLSSVKYLQQDKETAVALVEKVESFRFHLNNSERYWEAKYHIETDDQVKVDIADELIRLSPDNPRYYLFKGVAASQTGNNRVARDCIERATKMNPEYSLARNILHKFQRNALTPLFESFEEAELQAEPDNLPFHETYQYADVLTLGKVDAASTLQMTDLDKLYPKSPMWKYGLAGVTGVRKSDTRRIAAIIVYLLVVAVLISLFAVRLSENYLSMGAINFWCLVFVIALYTLFWGISTKTAWIYIFLTYFINIQTIRNSVKK